MRVVGYEYVADVAPDARVLRYRCPWRPHDLEVRFVRAWWDDGNLEEDVRVELREGDVLAKIIDVREQMERDRTRPLRDLLIRAIQACAGELSGKRPGSKL